LTGREKIEAAFSSDGTSEVPAVICYEGIFIRDHWHQLTGVPWWYQFAPDLQRQLAWRRDVIAAIDQDWFELPSCPAQVDREATTLEVNDGHVLRINTRTGYREELERPRVGGWERGSQVQSIHPDHLVETPEEIDKKIPAPAWFDPASFRAAGNADLAIRLLEEYGKQLCSVGGVLGPLWQTYDLWGFEGMMSMVATKPDLVDYACRRYLQLSINHLQHAAALGVEVIWIEDCLTDMISPSAFGRLNLPPLRALTDEIRALGMKSIYYYCGDPADRWSLLLDTGADALSLEEGKKNFTIDIADVAERVAGKLTLLGNLDAVGVLQDGSQETLRAEVRRQIAAGRRNNSRFIMSLGSPVTPATSVSRVRRYCDLVHQLGNR